MSRTTIHVCIVVPRRYDNQQQYIAHTGFVSLPVDHAHLGNSNDARICERIHITRRSHEVKWSIQESTQHDQDTPYLSPPYTTMCLRDITSYSVSQLLYCLGETCHQFSKGSVAVELSQNMASVHGTVKSKISRTIEYGLERYHYLYVELEISHLQRRGVGFRNGLCKA